MSLLVAAILLPWLTAVPAFVAALDGAAPAVPPWPQVTAGFSLNVHHVSDLPRYRRAIREIDDMGANALLIVTPWFQENSRSTRIARHPGLCPTREQLAVLVRDASARGLVVCMMPIVLLERPESTDDWRGTIAPEDEAAWWASYRAFILDFARLARETGCGMLAVGSELNTREPAITEWASLIADVRTEFPGAIVYSANWDRFDQVQFWNLVDVIGVSAYFGIEDPATGQPAPSRWQGVGRDFADLAEAWGRPILLTEVGYPSLSWAARDPWNYVAPPNTRSDPAMQRRCWEAFAEGYLPLIRNGGHLAGFFGFRFDPYRRGGAFDIGYGVAGKPAEAVVSRLLRDAAALSRGSLHPAATIRDGDAKSRPQKADEPVESPALPSRAGERVDPAD